MQADTNSVPLLRKLGIWDSTAIVVGTVIGTGVFLKTAVMAQQAGSVGAVLLAWTVAGILSLMGALTYSELAAAIPCTGGEYAFLREAYGRLPAFLFGWTRFWIISPGSIAAYAAGAATFFDQLIPLGSWRVAFAVLLILFFSFVNTFSVLVSGRLQTALTILKVGSIVGLAGALFAAGNVNSGSFLDSNSGPIPFEPSAFGAAVLAALWAFDGWSNLPLAAGEVKEPQKVLPVALAGGTALTLLIYAMVNAAYFYVLPLSEIVTSSSTLHPDAPAVAAKAAAVALGGKAVTILSALFVLSALGAMNGSVLTGARVPYAMAHDGLLFGFLGKVNSKTHVPAMAVAMQAIIAIVSVALGSFDQLTDYVVFSSWIFYGLVAASVFIFRRRGASRPFSTPGYPLMPILFVLSSVVLLGNTLWTAPKESGMGLILIATGLPFYYLFVHRKGGARAT